MSNQRYEEALTDAFAHITTQPRPASAHLLADAILARTAHVKPRRQSTGVRWLAAAAALLVVAGLLWSSMRFGSQPPVAGVPSPFASPSIINGEATASLAFDVDVSLPYESARIQVQRRDGDLSITATATKDGKAPTNLGQFTSQAATTWSLRVDDDLQLSLIPGDAKEVTSLSAGLVHSEYLGKVGMTAVAVEHGAASASQDLIWQGDDGQLHNSLGRSIPSAKLTAGSYDLTVFEDSSLMVWGYLDPHNDQRMTFPLDAEPVGKLSQLGGTSNGAYLEEASWVGVLPTGGREPQLEVQGERFGTPPLLAAPAGSRSWSMSTASRPVKP